MAAEPRMSETRVAIDTNVLRHLADDLEHVVDAVETIRSRVKGCRLVITVTVIHELAWQAEHAESPDEREEARKALGKSVHHFKIEPVNLLPVGHGIVDVIARKLHDAGLLPHDEKNDAYILAEAALLGCSILLTSDSHLRDISHEKLSMLLNQSDVRTPIIATPAEIVKKFFR